MSDRESVIPSEALPQQSRETSRCLRDARLVQRHWGLWVGCVLFPLAFGFAVFSPSSTSRTIENWVVDLLVTPSIFALIVASLGAAFVEIAKTLWQECDRSHLLHLAILLLGLTLIVVTGWLFPSWSDYAFVSLLVMVPVIMAVCIRVLLAGERPTSTPSNVESKQAALGTKSTGIVANRAATKKQWEDRKNFES
jgi:hypothetical protein